MIDDATDLFLHNSEVKAGLGLCDYGGRLCVWGADGEENIIRVSKINNPESFSQLDGFVIVDPQDVQGVTNCWPFRGQLYIQKSDKTFITSGNNNSPSTWPVDAVDLGIGGEINSVASINDTKGLNLDYTLIATQQGVLLFNGIYQHPEVTWNIESLWKTIPKGGINTIQVIHNPALRRIYICAPFGDLDFVGIGATIPEPEEPAAGAFGFALEITGEGENIVIDVLNTHNLNALMQDTFTQSKYFKLTGGNTFGFYIIESAAQSVGRTLYSARRIGGLSNVPTDSEEDYIFQRARYVARKVLVCDYDLGWDKPRWSLFTYESDIQGILSVDGELWVYGDSGMYKETELDTQRQEFSGLLPIEFEVGPLRQDETVYNHGPTVFDDLKIGSGFFSIRRFDRPAATSTVILGESTGHKRIINHVVTRKGIYNISALGSLSFVSMFCKLTEQWKEGVI